MATLQEIIEAGGAIVIEAADQPTVTFQAVAPPGPRGEAGEKGDRGDAGPTGEPGLAGPKGEAGAKGDKGDPGERGLTGPKGDQGDPGAAGPKGDAGERGLKGDRGETGDSGPTGLTGLKGDKGDQGERGLPGAKGDTGEPGAKGDQGLAGATGPKGDRGDTGLTGPKGEAGAKGDKGDPGLTGPKGDPGNSVTGPKGDRGDAGVAATIAIGTVSTGAAGSSATVTNSGTSSAAVLNFTIPRGDTGAAGSGGSSGSTAWTPVTATGTGASQAITLPESGLQPGAVLVFVNGLRFNASEYTISGSTLTLTSNAAGDAIEIIKAGGVKGDKGDAGAPGSGGGSDVSNWPILIVSRDGGESAAFQNVPSAAFVTVQVNNVIKDNHNAWNAGSYTWTVPQTGDYEITGKIRFIDRNSGGAANGFGVGMDIANQDSPGFHWFVTNVTGGGTARQGATNIRTMSLTQGQQIRLFVYCDGFAGSINKAELNCVRIR